MTLHETVAELEPGQRIKVGAECGTGYFYIGNAGDLSGKIKFGAPDLRGRRVVEVRGADEAADPGTTIILVAGQDKGRFWSTDERWCPALAYGFEWM